MLSNGRSEALLHHDGLPLPVQICPVRAARRLRLRIDHSRRLLKLTGPLRMDRKAALAWAAGQRAWIEEQLEQALPDEPFVHGATIPVEGEEVLLVWEVGVPRSARREGSRLVCGGPEAAFPRRIAAFLKRLALDTLSADTHQIADGAGLAVRAVSVGDAETRWGSCSAAGRIRYSWRLILAPREVRRYVIAHEVAHLQHMDHGREFRVLERQLFGGDTAAAQRLLRELGPRLKRIGRGG